MHLVCVLFTFENNTGHMDGRTDGPTDGHDLLQRCDGASKKGTGVQSKLSRLYNQMTSVSWLFSFRAIKTINNNSNKNNTR